MQKNIIVVGQGIIAQTFMQEYRSYSDNIFLGQISTDDYLKSTPKNIDAVLSCGSKNLEVAEHTSLDIPLIDLSPTFRLHNDWHYGFREFGGQKILKKYKPKRVANPSCIGTAANLILFPLKDCLPPNTPIYIDVVGGSSMAGSKQDQVERMTYLDRPHPHIEEIVNFSQLSLNKNDVWLHPKVEPSFSRGMRVAIPLPRTPSSLVIEKWQQHFGNEQDITILKDIPYNTHGGEYAMRDGATLMAIPENNGTLAVCLLDNLLKGAVETALKNLIDVLNWKN